MQQIEMCLGEKAWGLNRCCCGETVQGKVAATSETCMLNFATPTHAKGSHEDSIFQATQILGLGAGTISTPEIKSISRTLGFHNCFLQSLHTIAPWCGRLCFYSSILFQSVKHFYSHISKYWDPCWIVIIFHEKESWSNCSYLRVILKLKGVPVWDGRQGIYYSSLSPNNNNSG